MPLRSRARGGPERRRAEGAIGGGRAVSKIVWDGGRGREAVGMDAASAERQRAASNQIAARASLEPPMRGDRATWEDLTIGWKAMAERGAEIAQVRRQVSSTADPVSPSQLPPTRRVGQ